VRVVLASGSPRRRELLALIGLPFDVVPPEVDESVRPGEAPADLVRRLAVEKAEKVEKVEAVGSIVIGADTTVEIDGQILGKPTDAGDARRMLAALSGRTHRVHTAVAVCRHGETICEVVTTLVTMVAMAADTIGWYLATGEPMDKAGAYAIQGSGGAFVSRIDGNASNVVGLPLPTVVDLLRRQGVAAAR
jgi:septum formation protein